MGAGDASQDVCSRFQQQMLEESVFAFLHVLDVERWCPAAKRPMEGTSRHGRRPFEIVITDIPIQERAALLVREVYQEGC